MDNATKYLRWTMPGGEVASLMIMDQKVVEKTNDYGVVEVTKSQNRVRHWLSVLRRTQFANYSALPDLWDLKITYDENRREYRLWVYINNWPGRASFLAGILVGKARHWDRVQRRLRFRKKRSKAI